jgi:IS5 family transposase
VYFCRLYASLCYFSYGFKAHANVDEDGFVKKMTFTPGNVHDSQEFDKLLDCGRDKDKLKTCGEVYADSTYANKTNDKKLGKQNIKVLHRDYRNTSLTQVQKQENKQRSSIRYIVEGQLLDKAILDKISVRLKAISGFTLAISCSFNIVARFRVLSVVAIFAFALARLFGFPVFGALDSCLTLSSY